MDPAATLCSGHEGPLFSNHGDPSGSPIAQEPGGPYGPPVLVTGKRPLAAASSIRNNAGPYGPVPSACGENPLSLMQVFASEWPVHGFLLQAPATAAA